MKNKLILNRFFASLFTIALSAWLGIDSSNIVTSIRTMFKVWFHGFESTGIYYSAFFFGLSLVIWVYVFTRYLSSDQAENQSRFNETISAIYKAPNPFVHNKYPNFYRKIVDKLKGLSDEELTDKRKINLLKKVLEEILMFTQYFSTQEVDIKGANIMLYLPASDHYDLIDKLILDKKISFTDDKRTKAYAGVLITIPESYVKLNTKKNLEIPIIGLPVFNKIRIDGKLHQMPGAAFAIFEGNYICYKIDDLITNCSFMGDVVVSQLTNYFKKEGKDIKSFASFRIGSSKNPIAVLNIDSGEENVLGSAREYFATFNALLNPLLHTIEPLITDIRNNQIEQLIEKYFSYTESIDV
ncbi:hypothetical protein [Ekhidna sp. To15]|uniref:hypothetical protein n=1 Tax=Ekhidna sp. To15 TaxID=3395267 RepID=UPI003F51CFBB